MRRWLVAKTREELLDFVGLVACAPPPWPTSCLMGEQRLLEVARALAAEPRLLLARRARRRSQHARRRPKRSPSVIQRINARGVTIILIEHDMGLVMRIAQRIVVLDFGRKIAEGTPDEIRAHPDVLAAYLGGTWRRSMVDVVQLLQSLVNGVGRRPRSTGSIGIGFCVIYNASGIVNFAQGVFVMLGGMVCHTLHRRKLRPARSALAAILDGAHRRLPSACLMEVRARSAHARTAVPPCSPSSWRRWPTQIASSSA